VTARDLPARARTAALATALLLSVPTLAACAAAATNEVYTPTKGVNNRDGQVDVLHALVVSDGKDGGRLVAGLVNSDQSQEDTLTGVSADGGTAQVKLGDGETTIPAGGLLQLANDDAAQVLVSGVKAGGYVRVTFQFADADPATLNVPVVQPGPDFEGVQVPGQVTPSVTAAQEPTPTDSGE
jgi:copper(I)-binding protein